MDTLTLIQWGLPILVGVITFIGGRAFERHKITQENRYKLLETVEEWVDQVNRLLGMVGDEIVSMSQGFPTPIGYNWEERKSTANLLTEKKDKVLGILKSGALHTHSTEKSSKQLNELILKLVNLIEREFLPKYNQLSMKLEIKEDSMSEFIAIIILIGTSRTLIQEVYMFISQLKTKFN